MYISTQWLSSTAANKVLSKAEFGIIEMAAYFKIYLPTHSYSVMLLLM